MSNINIRHNIAKRARHGQMLIVAIAILFVLLIIGGVFVSQIGRNLAAASRSTANQSAEALAEAGIRFCDSNFTLSPEGADWRPVPSQPAFNSGVTDPDYRWLQAGFTRLYFQGGRALIRVVYDPHADDPRSGYLRIESVGRQGDLGQVADPTVFSTDGNAPRQRREMIAYKQIGLTDYLRWMTNIDHRNVNNFLGIPATENVNGIGAQGYNDVSMVLGDPRLGLAVNQTGVAGNEVLFGAPIRSNSTLQLGGELHIYESFRGGSPNISPETMLTSGDFILAPNQLIGNNLLLNDNDHQVFVNQPLNVVPTVLPVAPNYVLPSTDPNFLTFSGVVRDGRTVPDFLGINRSIPYLDPPVIDSYVEGSGSLRYRDLTRLSGAWVNTGGGQVNTGFYGWGTGVYIDNNSDLQAETQNVNGGYSMRADWLNPQAQFSHSYWSGPYYRPPGVLIELMGDHIRLTRSDGKSFRKPDGNPITAGGGNVVDIPLRDADRAAYVFPDGTTPNPPLPALAHDGDDQSSVTRDPNTANFPHDKASYGVSLVIMAEGNVRVKGTYGTTSNTLFPAGDHLSRVHLTIVSGGTAYIDGNILKRDGYQDGSGFHPEKASTCAIMAKDYVTVNTTMFMAAANQGPSWSSAGGDLQYFGIPTDAPSYDPVMSFGINPRIDVNDPTSGYTIGGAPSQLFLFMRHAAQTNNSGAGSTAMQLSINPALQIFPPPPDLTHYRFDGPGVQVPGPLPGLFPAETYPLGQKYNPGALLFMPDPAEVNPNFEHRVFPLTGQVVGAVFTPDFTHTQIFPLLNPFGDGNVFHFEKDVTAVAAGQGVLAGFSETEDYLFSGAMVAPLDIRIEAMLYAQERSFFVIPGYSFNQNPNDTRTNFLKTNQRPIYDSLEGGNNITKLAFPFYNEPMDVKITIFGAVSENYTASAGDQAAWIGKWGYIPEKYGSSGISIPDQHLNQVFRTPKEQQDHIARGMEFVYDPALSLPYGTANGTDLTNTMNPAAAQARVYRSMRSKYYASPGPGISAVVQTLPSIPRLPVCPGLLYFGPADAPVVP